MGFTDVIKSIPGLTHYYPLDATNQAKDVVGTAHGTNHGVTFGADGASFDGTSYISLPDHDDFSVATKGGLSILSFVTVRDWKGAGASEYVHWMGKGKSGAHEWTFRHYVKGGTGEASTRQGRMSFYHYNPPGGLGAGSYYQDSSFPTTERTVIGRCDLTTVSLAVNGSVRDSDALSGYSIKPVNTGTPPCIGSRGDGTGFLVGKIRRVAFFNHVLTPAEIGKIEAARGQAEGSDVEPPTPPTPTPDPTPDPLLVPPGATKATLITAHNNLVKALRNSNVI